MKRLAVSMECWNCENSVPFIDGTSYFKYVAVETSGDFHPICEDCSKLQFEIASGPVEVFEQVL